ncbi:MAG: hypothetical protein ACR2MX_19345, partial [Cyclobacteriaceae bacterium]
LYMSGGYFFVKQMQDSIRSNQRLLDKRRSLQKYSTHPNNCKEPASSDYEALKKWKTNHLKDRLKETTKVVTITFIVSLIVAAAFGYIW